jgi:hypothetical protein
MTPEDNANSIFVKLLEQQRHDHKDDIPRREKGHLAVITFKIDVRPMNADNTFDNYLLSNRDLQRYGISNKAQMIIKGSSEADCIKKVKNMMEKINGE